MKNYKLTIAYDGTNYAGWQYQLNDITIQQVIEEAINRILQIKISLIGSGRTDTGVHALAQTANFKIDKEIDTKKFTYSLNCLLPTDIRILNIEEVDESFHSQYSAKGKIYHYNMLLSRMEDPFTRNYHLHYRGKIDVEAMKEATYLFIGTKDFTSFANETHSDNAPRSAVRTIYRLDLIEDGANVRLEFEGNGFLYKMVRNITGTLLQVGLKKLTTDEIIKIFEAKDRKAAGPAAPPQGLFLVKVLY
jgi:tRNA pseudouridine38-40 synthase